ncbi:MAG: hypothetical protein ACYS1A_18095 [Planctomycetota bacterium]|jgi:hypothetical protein
MSDVGSIQEMYPDPSITRGYRSPARLGSVELPIDTEQIRRFFDDVNWKHAALFAAIGYFLGGRRR